MIGTGPFMLKHYEPGVSMEYVRNPDYWKKDEFGNQLPYLDGIKIFKMTDRNAQVDAFATKRLDMLRPSIGVTSKSIEDRIKEIPGQDGVKWATMASQIFWINIEHEPYDKIEVRQAMALALDNEAAVLGGFGSLQMRLQKYTVLPVPYGITQAEKNKILGWDLPYADRIAKAKQLLADVGLSDGFKMKLLTANIPELVAYSEAVADMFRAINIEVEIASVTFGERAKQQAAGDWDFLNSGLSMMANDPDEIMADFMTGSPSNVPHYSNAEVDRLIPLQSMEPDMNKRIEMCQEIERMILSDLPMIPQGFSSFGTAWWPWVKGFVKQDTVYGGYLRMEKVWIDESLK